MQKNTTKNGKLPAGEPTRRIAQATAWLLEGMRSREVVLKACDAWGVKKRMAQVYVAKAKDRLIAESWNKHLMHELDLVQDIRLRTNRTVNAVVNDPEVDPAHKRAAVAYFGKLNEMLAGYEKTAVRMAELRTKLAPSEDALFRMQGVLDELEKLNDDEDLTLVDEPAVSEPKQEAPAPEADVTPVPEPEEDESAPAPRTLADELEELTRTHPGNGHLAHSEAEAHLPCAVAVPTTSCRHSVSEFLAKTHCADPEPLDSAADPARTSASEQVDNRIRRF